MTSSVTCGMCLGGRHLRCHDRAVCACRRCAVRPPALARAVTPERRAPARDSGPRRGVGRPSKLTGAQMDELKALVAAGASVSETARRFGVARKTVHRVVTHEYKNARSSA